MHIFMSSEAKENFVLAAENGDIKLIIDYLQKGNVTVDCKNTDDYTALMEAAMNGHKEIVNVLISYKCDVNVKRNCGATALMYASGNGHKVAYLISSY